MVPRNCHQCCYGQNGQNGHSIPYKQLGITSRSGYTEISVRSVRSVRDVQDGPPNVRDKGIGIAAADQSQIFEKFYRSDDQEVTTKNGQGLGLALVKQIATIHYGTVSVKSEKNHGSEFRIEIKKDTHTLRQAV